MIDFDNIEEEKTPAAADDSQLTANPTVIKIIGCGGGGSSAVKRMIEVGVKDVEFIVLNTDLQALKMSPAPKRIPIGQAITGGLGAGGNPVVGEQAAKEDSEVIKGLLEGADMVIITAGMGGGTGTGSAPIVAQLAQELGILTIAVVTTPFEFEAAVRMANAKEGLKKLRKYVDSLIVIPNQQCLKVSSKDKAASLPYKKAFLLADNVLCEGVRGISEIITIPGEINLDFNDVRSVMKGAGDAILGVGAGEGENRAIDAAQNAISNPMLENSHIDGATKILINITSDDSLTMPEIDEISNNIKASASQNVELFLGLVDNPDMAGRVSVTVIATGFNKTEVFDDAEDTAKKDDDDNLVDYGVFQKIIGGTSSSAAESDADSEEDQRFSTVSVSEDGGYEDTVSDDDVFDRDGFVSGQSHHESLKHKATHEVPPGYKVDPEDLSQPAIYRRKLDGLSRGINLSED